MSLISWETVFRIRKTIKCKDVFKLMFSNSKKGIEIDRSSDEKYRQINLKIILCYQKIKTI